jgi:UDP-2,4-diacetamido-2,4,6-trideoxy-beta-L-altropyranose hydrolase
VTRRDDTALLRVIVRPAASAEVGAGHAARTAAIARELQRIGAEVQWACDADAVPYLLELGVAAEAIRTLHAAATAGRRGEEQSADEEQALDAMETLAHSGSGTDWVLVDSYQLGAAWQRAARDAGAKVATLDDLADRPIDADLVVNAAARAGQYDSLAPKSRVLSGLKYAVVGDPSRPPAAGPGTLLVSFGAADTRSFTEATIRTLALRVSAEPGRVPRTVIQLGGRAACRDHVAELVAALPWTAFAPEGQTSPGSPTLAIGAAGVGLLERMHAGVPSVVVVAARNQHALATAAVRAGAAVAVDTPEAGCDAALALLADPGTLDLMSRAGKMAVDGRGAARVAREMNRITGVDLRRATMAEAEVLYRWRNHPSVRSASHLTEEITWETHMRWLEASLARDDRHVLVAERRSRPVGTLRFDVVNDYATVSIAVDPSLHGCGLGPAILDSGECWIRDHDRRVRQLRAEIRTGNEASVRAFRAAGYRDGPETFERTVGCGSTP